MGGNNLAGTFWSGHCAVGPAPQSLKDSKPAVLLACSEENIPFSVMPLQDSPMARALEISASPLWEMVCNDDHVL